MLVFRRAGHPARSIWDVGNKSSCHIILLLTDAATLALHDSGRTILPGRRYE